MYWLLHRAQHTRDINIHKLDPFPKKIGLNHSADFLHSGTGYIENNRVRSIIDFFADFSQNFSERALLVLSARSEKFNHDFNHEFNRDFLHSGTPLYSTVMRPKTRLNSKEKQSNRKNMVELEMRGIPV